MSFDPTNMTAKTAIAKIKALEDADEISAVRAVEEAGERACWPR